MVTIYMPMVPETAIIEKETGRLPVARLRYLLMVLDRNLTWKKEIAVILRTVVHEVSGLELYTETGLPRELGLWSELSDRLMMKLLPTPPLDHELGYLFWALFPAKEDPLWISSIDNVTFDKLVELFNFEVGTDEQDWNRFSIDLEDALVYLVIQVRAIGLSPAIRYRLDKPNFRDSAFFALVRGLEEFVNAYHAGDRNLTLEKASRFRMIVWECRRELAQVHKHLDEYGVSVDLVFQMARLRTYLQRVDSLLEILLNERLDAKKVTSFLSKLVEENQDLRSISSLMSQNISLLARKVVERAAETGEHYITRTKDEYRRMLQAAGGGGAITALTVYVKIGILALGLSGFMEGMLASINYALSFVAIHLAGFTLGTKQPAMTAPALAAKMQDVDSEKGMNDLVTDITHIIRSQVAAVSGNVMFVVPCVILIDAIFNLLFGGHMMSVEKAQYAFKSVDILGPAFIYAGFTGILLWSSSVFSGWSDNWFALNALRKTLARSPTLKAVFGKRGARNIAVFFENNISGLAGNISLGVMLGMTPEILKFMGIPLDVRHVTLSSGTLGGALPVLGLDFMKTWDFWRAVIGIFFIGAFNVLISFGLALWVAIKARGVQPPQRKAIRQAVVKRFFSSPLSFFLPVGANVPKSSGGNHGH
ncbi:site-specific recombinase [Bdellovibrio bacteriovorus]|uniref:site-specific recombinase n=1 Tax=Bdellovibrio bacteriovorus TaxID=959 RepID=UPI0021D10B03|nr:site-specific recombinase [Bdellovibrio bacteriovorus]UXR63297.1 site-specific recombinase [Bdellovibrio bacteriovorus]